MYINYKIIRIYFHAGVTLTNDPSLPFTVGQNAVLTCSSDSGVEDRIQWVSRDGVVLASGTSVQQLQFMLRPVNDSLSVHSSNYTCSVTRDEGQTIINQTLPVTVTSRCLLTYTYICSPNTSTHPQNSQIIVTCIYNTPPQP